MAKLKLPSFNDGSLLKRTMLYIATFVVGSVGFVALASVLVVWAAKSVLPSHSAAAAAGDADKSADLAAALPGKTPGTKAARSKRGKTSEEAPAEEAP